MNKFKTEAVCFVFLLQCQVVLQGKSRSLIVRELQRTVCIYRVDEILVFTVQYLVRHSKRCRVHK